VCVCVCAVQGKLISFHCWCGDLSKRPRERRENMWANMLIAVVLATLSLVSGHARWKCPPPRDANDDAGNHITFDNTGNKYAACGPQSGRWGFGQVTTLAPGWTTLTWEESINHAGSPFRLAILDETESARIIMLDHIPHNDDTHPVVGDESTYAPYHMSVNIPDVDCKKCSIQLLYLMTDKVIKCGIDTCYYNPADAACKGSTDPNAATCAGAPNSNVCVQENECFSNYHSCTDVIITGTQSVETFALNSQPADWPFATAPIQYYTKESGSWKDGWVTGVPSNYTTQYSNLQC
jgi:hypothetical protein